MFNVFHNPLTFEKLLKWLESVHADFGFLGSFLSSSSASSPSSLSMSPCHMSRHMASLFHPRTDLDDHLVSAEDDGIGQQGGEHSAHADEGPQLQDGYV